LWNPLGNAFAAQLFPVRSEPFLNFAGNKFKKWPGFLGLCAGFVGFSASSPAISSRGAREQLAAIASLVKFNL
jgi:hypothetical protein